MVEGFTVISGSAKNELSNELTLITDIAKEKYKGINIGHHEWVEKLDNNEYKKAINKVRTSDVIINKIKEKYPDAIIKNVTESDEIYWSVSPKSATGSNRTLVDCHYDAPFAILPTFGVIFYRVIIATNENNDVITVFPNENVRVKMNTGEFHGLDYNKDWHCVEGEIPEGKYRILLKLHYIITEKGSEKYEDYVKFINVRWNQITRETMRMSANPQNILESFVGILVNTFREIYNNIYIIIITLILLYIFSTKMGKNIFIYIKKNLKRK